MKDTLKPGIRYEHKFVVPLSKTVPALYPEAQEFIEMPEVLATGFLVGFLEWACIKAIKPYLDWPDEQSLGTHINVSHEAASERFVINKKRFDAKMAEKATSLPDR